MEATEVRENRGEADYKSLQTHTHEGVGEIVLRGPGKGNAMGPDFWNEFPQAVRALDLDKSVRAVVVRGNGKDFSFGLDLPAMMPVLAAPVSDEKGKFGGGKFLGSERLSFLQVILKLQEAFSLIERSPKPYIAAVSGWCIGGGLDLISACDIRLCSKDAKFSLREVKVAIVADLGSLQRLPHIIGQGYTRELAFTGKDVDAAKALQMGLVNEVLEDPEALKVEAFKLALEIASNAPLVVQGTKTILNESRELGVSAGLKNVALWNSAFLHSEELGEAMQAFAEKRAPKF
jgi:enoyl-CoA hydratase